ERPRSCARPPGPRRRGRTPGSAPTGSPTSWTRPRSARDRAPVGHRSPESRADEALDRLLGFLNFALRVGAARGERVLHAVSKVVTEQLEGDPLEGPSGRRDLGEHVDAVGVLVHHALEATDLALDPPQASTNPLLVVGVARHSISLRPLASRQH